MALAPHAHPSTGPPLANTEDRLRLLIQTGLLLASERNPDVVVQAALDAGLHLCGARFGAFFLSDIGGNPPNLQSFRAAALDHTLLAASGSAQPTAFAEIFFSPASRGVQRFDDITQPAQDFLLPLPPRFGGSQPFPGMSPGHDDVRSLLAVPVRSPRGDLLGGLLYGDPSAAVFDTGCEELVSTVASQAAVALDNARLAATLSHEIALTDSARALQRQTADRLRQALDAAQLGTWSWDRASDLMDLDDLAAQLFHVEPHAAVTRSALRERIVLAEDRPETLRNLQRSLESGGLYTAEYRVDGSAGQVTWVFASGIATFSPGSSEITGMVGTIQDITARKNTEAALRQGEKLAATGRLAATIAHEINNPLEAVTNLIYLSKTDPAVPEPVKQLLDTADHELARVAQIAQQTLGFYRDTGRPVEIDLNDLLQRSADLFARKMQSRKIACTLDLTPGLRITALPGEIRQVVSNLLVNAIDASPGSGAIHIRGRRRNHHSRPGVCMLVCDRGSGIPTSVRSRLFSPFFTTKESIGTGLGLWVTRGIVEKHGGCISFRSRTDPPSGTVFRVFLPAKIVVSDVRQTRG